jgi:hypothetical protein
MTPFAISKAYLILQQAVTLGCFPHTVRTFKIEQYRPSQYEKTVSWRDTEKNVLHVNNHFIKNECDLAGVVAYWSSRDKKSEDKNDLAQQKIQAKAIQCCHEVQVKESTPKPEKK